jgi:hypothetical protein
MRYLAAFLISLAVLAAVPAFAEDTNAGCVTVEKFVEQNKGTADIKWEKTLAPHQVNPVRDALGVPSDANVTEIRLFTATVHGKEEAAIAFGHDNLVCVYATLPPAGVMLVRRILEATEKDNGKINHEYQDGWSDAVVRGI